MQRIDDEAAVLDILHEAGVTQDAEMVRNVDDLRVQQRRQFADIVRPPPQHADDA